MNGETLDVPSHCLGDGEVSSPGPDPVPDCDPVPDLAPVDPVPVPASVSACGIIPSASVHQVQYETSVYSPRLARDLNLHHSLNQQSLTAALHPSDYPKQESFRDVAVSLPHDPDNPFSGLSDASSLASSNRIVSTGIIDLPDILGYSEDVSCSAPSVRIALLGVPEFLHLSLPEASVPPELLDPSLPDASVYQARIAPSPS